MLNKVFRRRGAGWTAYSTGIRKILDVVKKYKNQDFPTSKLFEMYHSHPLEFSETIKKERLNQYDFNFLMYIIYEKPKSFRVNDIDHIHPKSILLNKQIEWSKINNVGNFQLLDYSTNRGNKNDIELKDWIETVIENKENYLEMHLIPKDETLWLSDRFEDFLIARQELLVTKLKKGIK